MNANLADSDIEHSPEDRRSPVVLHPNASHVSRLSWGSDSNGAKTNGYEPVAR